MHIDEGSNNAKGQVEYETQVVVEEVKNEIKKEIITKKPIT